MRTKPPIRKMTLIKNFTPLDNPEFTGSCIYVIRNIDNNKLYIGQSSNFKSRYRYHKVNLDRGSHTNRYLLRAYQKGESFEISVLEYCGIDSLNERELFWIEFFKSYIKENGYNLTKGGDGIRGYKHSLEARDKISVTHKGRVLSDPTTRYKPVIAYSLYTGEFIGEYISSKHAAEKLELRRNAISGVLSGDHQHTQGYIFKFKESELYPMVIEVDRGKRFFVTKVDKFTPDGVKVETIERLDVVAKILGRHKETTRKMLQSGPIVHEGFTYKHWRLL